MSALQTFEASLRHSVRERQAATVGGGYFTYQELEEVLTEIMALRAEVAALSANAVDDAQAIERKDALLRQAEQMMRWAADIMVLSPQDAPGFFDDLNAIKQELSQ